MRPAHHVSDDALPGRIYGICAHLVFWSVALFVWAAVLLLPSPGLRWRVTRRAMRLIARVLGIRIRVRGLEHLPPSGHPYILVANHASYADSPLLILALPRPFSFVAKAELRTHAAIRTFLRRLDVEFVERRRAHAAARDLQALAALSRNGRTLLFFPEGTLRRDPGLLPFRLGAFLVAAEERIPCVPVAIHGSRALLRDGSWWPGRGDITITIGPPIEPADSADEDRGGVRQAAQALRDDARHWIMEHSGEAVAATPAAGN